MLRAQWIYIWLDGLSTLPEEATVLNFNDRDIDLEVHHTDGVVYTLAFHLMKFIKKATLKRKGDKLTITLFKAKINSTPWGKLQEIKRAMSRGTSSCPRLCVALLSMRVECRGECCRTAMLHATVDATCTTRCAFR